MLYRVAGVVGIALGIGMMLVESYLFGIMLIGAGALLMRYHHYSHRRDVFGPRRKDKDKEKQYDKEKDTESNGDEQVDQPEQEEKYENDEKDRYK